MLRLSSRSIKSSRQFFRQSSKRYSSGHHEEPLAPAANILESYLVTPVLLTIGCLGIYKLETSYRKSHNGESLTSFLGEAYNFDTLTKYFKEYQEAVSDERKLYELISFTPKHDKDHYPLHIDGVPGQYFPFNAASNFSVSVDFKNLEERRKPFDDFK